MKLPNEYRDTTLYNIVHSALPTDYQTVIAEHWRDGAQVGTVTCAATADGDGITLSFVDGFMAQIGDVVWIPEDGFGMRLESVFPIRFRMTREAPTVGGE